MIPTIAAVQRARQAGEPSSERAFREDTTSQFKKAVQPQDESEQADDGGGDADSIDMNLRDDAVEIEGPTEGHRDEQVGREGQSHAAQEQENDDRDEGPAVPPHGPPAFGFADDG